MIIGDTTLGSDLLEEFWCWAVAKYENVQVREGLLELQEVCDLIILETMFIAWLGHRGRVICAEDQQRMREAITPWVDGILLPLRRQRHAWTDVPSMTTNRCHLLELELEAERVLAKLLIDALPMGEHLKDTVPPEVDRNLALLPELKDAVSRARVTDMLVF